MYNYLLSGFEKNVSTRSGKRKGVCELVVSNVETLKRRDDRNDC